jgi:hypothetical protein
MNIEAMSAPPRPVTVDSLSEVIADALCAGGEEQTSIHVTHSDTAEHVARSVYSALAGLGWPPLAALGAEGDPMTIDASNRFVQIPRAAAQDERLSYRARGILTAVLGRPPQWPVSAEDLTTSLAADSPREGRDAIRVALRELAEAGYLRRTTVLDPDRRWATTWDLMEVTP